MLWRSVTSLIILVFAVECATTANKSANVCSTPGCEDAANVLVTNMDKKEQPCKDFYSFACGGFIKSTPIPKNEHHIGRLHILQEKIFTQIKEVLDKKVDPSEPRIFELAKNYYRSCMDESTQQLNLQTLLNVIKKLGGWPLLEGSKWEEENFEVFKLDRKLRNIGYRPSSIFKLSVLPNPLNTSQSLLFIGPSEPPIKSESHVQPYYKYMTEVAVLLGADKKTAEQSLKKVIEFEKELIWGMRPDINVIDSMNPSLIRKLYEDVDEDYPWLEYINDMTEPIARFKNHSIINVADPDYLQTVAQALYTAEKEVVANYMIWKVIAESIWYLPNEFRQLTLGFLKEISKLEVPLQMYPRWRECVNLLTDKKGGLAVAVSSMYIRKYFNDTSRKEVEPLISSIDDAFKETINKTTWIGGSVEQAALKKLELMRKIIAYPDELLNDAKLDEYSRSLNISSTDHFQNFLNLQRFHYEFELSNLNQSTEVNLWEVFTDSTTVNAMYYSLSNSFVLLAAILQRPIFNPEWPSYVRFGSIGFIISHEMMHAYDSGRILYDAMGTMSGWMNGPSKTEFRNRLRCIYDQYFEYEDKLTGKKLDGDLTLTENVADSGGLKIAYRAYRNWVKKHGEDPRPAQLQNYTADQLFFVSAINYICGKSTKAQRNDELKDKHSPYDLRTLGMLSNSQEFAKAFSCPVGSIMNPVKKCAVWD